MAIDSSDNERTFLDRWAKRKADVRDAELREKEAEGIAVVEEPQLDLPVDADGVPLVAEPDGSELTEEDVEKLDKGSDFTAFMKAAVPAEIKRMALKKLWASDPAYNIVDGLVEYGEDYSQLHVNVGKIKSAYQVGKGYVTEEEDGDDLATSETREARADELGEPVVDDPADLGEIEDDDKDEYSEPEDLADADVPIKDDAERNS